MKKKQKDTAQPIDELRDEARAIREIKQKRLEACNAALGELLQRHGCALVGVPFIAPDGRITARVELVPKE